MLETRVLSDLKYIDEIVDIHMRTFTGFFLTFLGKGFLRHLYKGFIIHDKSNIIGAFDEGGNLMGFLAYSEDISQFYKQLLKKSLIPFAWYSFIAFLKKPKIMFRLLRAFTYSESSKNEDLYIELSSIGVLPVAKNKGIGTMLISELKKIVNTNNFKYIKLETDKINNDSVNAFYLKNGFKLYKSYVTREGRNMNEYRYELNII
ncbi:MAG TPA: GNAT family N-acetyltransferase [Clostridiales bacterium]|nr:GNAT family N-acetyltransferase [Clostridiales bacterium]